MAPPVGILGPVPAVRGLGFAWKQTGLGAGPEQFQVRSPVYAVRINVDWRIGSTFSLLPLVQPLPPFNQLYWPLTPAVQQPERTITASYNPNLIGQDRLPTGDQVSAILSPAPVYSNILRTWTQSLLQSTLIPPTTLPTGEQVYDRPSTGPLQPAKDWVQNLLQNTLAPAVTPPDTTHLPRAPIYTNPREYPYHIQLRSWASTILPYATTVVQNPFFQTDWPLTPAAKQIDRTITEAFNLDLIGQDKLPTGKNVSDLTPRPAAEPATRTWAWSYNLNLIGKDQLPVGDISTALTTKPYEYHVQLRTWAWAYNLNLIGKDQFPSGEIFYDRPPLAAAGVFQTWLYSINLNLITVQQNPFFQTDWPLTPAAKQIDRTITASFNDNLIGQDKLPFRQTDWPNPTQPYRQPQLASWIDQVKFLLAVPFKQTDWPNPRAPQQPAQSFTGSYNLNLVGQDQLPPGEDSYNLPPQPALSAIQLRTWINSVNVALVIGPQFPRPPFNQFDWPINPGPRQPTQLFYASYNKNLIGQDKLPPGEIVTDLPPRGAAPLVQVWLQGFSPFRPATIILYPHNQFDWPNPRGAWDGKDRTIAVRSQFLQPVTPPPQFPNVEAPPVRDFWDVDEWGNFIKGYCVRGR